ncbi:SCO family protein [Pseudooceanicola sp.]|uniref:SCO family protein n=1 Tax=Pseudooceanicola sp. TaxID=1914328 RepID=UPI002611F2F9|nr:SCO family protein [Pseudooceanicola sp.]MDF1855742.1 SCO family protein [Pseudooceanicola sp.]
MTLSRKHVAFITLWGLAVLALILVAWVRLIGPMFAQSLSDTIGPGEYHLTTTKGTAFTEATLRGQPSAVFFGFTHCPEVCPTTLGDIATWKEELGDTVPLRVFFVTVDPERDTVDQLRDYVSWVPDVQGVSGPREEIDKAIKAFRIYARKVPLEDGDYTMDHSANVLLFDDKGRFFEPIGYQEDYDRALDKIRRLNAS